MIGAGADPTTQAPGPGSAPGTQPGAAVLAQASALPPGMDPNSHEAYSLLHPIAPTPEERALFDAQPKSDQLQVIQNRKANLNQNYQDAMRAGNVPAALKAREDFDKAQADENTLQENARKLGVETQAKFYEAARKQRFDAWTAEQKQRTDQATADQAARTKQEEIAATSATRLSTEAGAIVETTRSCATP
jgi:hypothetical protein